MNVLYISTLDWGFTKQRPHHIATIISRHHKVYFLHFTSIINLVLKKQILSPFRVKSKGSSLSIITIGILPNIRNAILQSFNKLAKKQILAYLLRKYNIELVVLTHPLQYELIQERGTPILYDCMDFYQGFVRSKEDKESIKKCEKELVKNASIVTCSSGSLKEYIREEYSKDCILINNGCEIRDLSSSNTLYLNPDEKYTIGYVGAVADWIDWALIEFLALEHTNCLFSFYGPIVTKTETKKLSNLVKSHSNIELKGLIPYSMVHKVIDSFDVCIYPFINDKFTSYVDPVKVYEYLSLGKPVLSITNKETEKFKDYVYLGKSPKEISSQLRKAIENRQDKMKREQRIAFARLNSWNSRGDMILSLLNSLR